MDSDYLILKENDMYSVHDGDKLLIVKNDRYSMFYNKEIGECTIQYDDSVKIMTHDNMYECYRKFLSVRGNTAYNKLDFSLSMTDNEIYVKKGEISLKIKGNVINYDTGDSIGAITVNDALTLTRVLFFLTTVYGKKFFEFLKLKEFDKARKVVMDLFG